MCSFTIDLKTSYNAVKVACLLGFRTDLEFVKIYAVANIKELIKLNLILSLN